MYKINDQNTFVCIETQCVFNYLYYNYLYYAATKKSGPTNSLLYDYIH